MADGKDCRQTVARGSAANDNGGAEERIDAAVMTLARLIGRRIVRERFAAAEPANDNMPARGVGEGQERCRSRSTGIFVRNASFGMESSRPDLHAMFTT